MDFGNVKKGDVGGYVEKEKSCNNCKYYRRTVKRNKHGKVIAFSSACKSIKTCINYECWERKKSK